VYKEGASAAPKKLTALPRGLVPRKVDGSSRALGYRVSNPLHKMAVGSKSTDFRV